jgi:hypothetical protein
VRISLILARMDGLSGLDPAIGCGMTGKRREGRGINNRCK